MLRNLPGATWASDIDRGGGVLAVGDSQMFAWPGLDETGLRGDDKWAMKPLQDFRWVTIKFCRTNGYSDRIFQTGSKLITFSLFVQIL
jgi:hypothetical protein